MAKHPGSPIGSGTNPSVNPDDGGVNPSAPSAGTEGWGMTSDERRVLTQDAQKPAADQQETTSPYAPAQKSMVDVTVRGQPGSRRKTLTGSASRRPLPLAFRARACPSPPGISNPGMMK